jgi:hypothetical protein
MTTVHGCPTCRCTPPTYRTASLVTQPPPARRRPLFCRLGWHRREIRLVERAPQALAELGYDHYYRSVIYECDRCGLFERRWTERSHPIGDPRNLAPLDLEAFVPEEVERIARAKRDEQDREIAIRQRVKVIASKVAP